MAGAAAPAAVRAIFFSSDEVIYRKKVITNMNSFDDNKLGQCKGFTLMEILLAMLITSILILGVNTAYRQAHLTWSSAENKRPIYHTARLVTETLRQELSCLYFPPTTEDEDADSPFTLLYLPNEKTEFTFYTLTPSWKGSLESSRVARVRYKFSRDPDTEETLLERFEQPCGGEKIIGKKSSDLVVKGLSDFRVWVIDPNSGPYDDSWKESYNSEDTPPKALKVSLKWAATDKAPGINFRCCTLIPCDSAAF
jgi:prepilin-type N-terminal cleavage/methylation domain-containing protein